MGTRGWAAILPAHVGLNQCASALGTRCKHQQRVQLAPSSAPLQSSASLACLASWNSTKAMRVWWWWSPRSRMRDTGPGQAAQRHQRVCLFPCKRTAVVPACAEAGSPASDSSARHTPRAHRTASQRMPARAACPPSCRCWPRTRCARTARAPRACAAGTGCSPARWRSWTAARAAGMRRPWPRSWLQWPARGALREHAARRYIRSFQSQRAHRTGRPAPSWPARLVYAVLAVELDECKAHGGVGVAAHAAVHDLAALLEGRGQLLLRHLRCQRRPHAEHAHVVRAGGAADMRRSCAPLAGVPAGRCRRCRPCAARFPPSASG